MTAGPDLAAPWLGALVDSGGTDDLHRALETQPSTQAEAWIVLTAAELVAAAAGQPAPDLPEATRAWVEQNAPEAAQLIDLAREAITRATRPGSPLHALWSGEEASDFSVWTLRLAELERRLGVP